MDAGLITRDHHRMTDLWVLAGLAVIASALSCGCAIVPKTVSADADPNLALAQEAARELPDPLLMENGERVHTVEQWSVRRDEMKRLLLEHEYGTMPAESTGARLQCHARPQLRADDLHQAIRVDLAVPPVCVVDAEVDPPRASYGFTGGPGMLAWEGQAPPWPLCTLTGRPCCFLGLDAPRGPRMLAWEGQAPPWPLFRF